jgi:DNA repair protein RadC
MNVREMPWFGRPGARLKRSGPEVLSDAELLAGADRRIKLIKINYKEV